MQNSLSNQEFHTIKTKLEQSTYDNLNHSVFDICINEFKIHRESLSEKEKECIKDYVSFRVNAVNSLNNVFYNKLVSNINK